MDGNNLDTPQYQIKKIKDKKIKNGDAYYLVSWENFNQGNDSWIQGEYIQPDLIREFEINNSNIEELHEEVENFKLKSILDMVEIETQIYFLVELDSGKSYIPKESLQKVASKQLRSFLVSYYARISTYCSSF